MDMLNERIESYRTLARGWYMGEGGPLSETVLSIAKELCHYLSQAGAEESDVEDFPFSDGRLEIVHYRNQESAYHFLINAVGAIRVVFTGGSQRFTLGDKLSLLEAVSIANFYHAWRSFDTSTFVISAKGKGILAARALNPPQKGSGQWFGQIASSLSAGIRAPMANDIIRTNELREELQAGQFFSRRLISKNFPAQAFTSRSNTRETRATTTPMESIHWSWPAWETSSRTADWGEFGYATTVTAPQPLPPTNYSVSSGTSTTARFANEIGFELAVLSPQQPGLPRSGEVEPRPRTELVPEPSV